MLLSEDNSKGKGLPRTGHEGPEGEQTYSSTLSLTSARDGVGGQRNVPAALPPGKRPGTRCVGGWVGPGPVRTGTENPARGIRTIETIASLYTDRAVPAYPGACLGLGRLGSCLGR